MVYFLCVRPLFSQAQARCHRIGQSKAVKVYRLITRNSYEREMFDKASLKLGLDKAVLQDINRKGNLNGVSCYFILDQTLKVYFIVYFNKSSSAVLQRSILTAPCCRHRSSLSGVVCRVSSIPRKHKCVCCYRCSSFPNWRWKTC